MKRAYEFVANEVNIERLKNYGFDNLIGVRDYFYTKVEVEQTKVDIHIIYIDKTTNLLRYRLNNDDYERIELEKLHPMIARKLSSMIELGIIVPTTRTVEKVKGYRK